MFGALRGLGGRIWGLKDQIWGAWGADMGQKETSWGSEGGDLGGKGAGGANLGCFGVGRKRFGVRWADVGCLGSGGRFGVLG